MTKWLLRFYRLLHINFILARYGLDRIILSIRLFAPLRFFIFLNPLNWRKRQRYTRGVAVRKALEELGPIFVKFGQALSTRRDLLPDDIADELALLLDQVPPFPSKTARRMIEEAYGQKISEAFAEFEDTPLASASIAQVHAAKLLSGEEVVVKVLRPNVRKAIRRDLDILYTVARLAQTYWADGKRLRPVEVVAEFEQTLSDELDLIREAANASQLKRNFSHSNQLYVPEVYWPYVRENVLVMERISGIPISNVEELKRRGVDLKHLAQMGVDIFFTQVLRDRFFHADMHPGNIFVSVEDPKKPRYIAVDFGIMGSLDGNDQRYLAENFLAFFNRDYRRVAELHLQSGWVPPKTRVDAFEGAIRTVCEPIFSKPLKDISCGLMLLRLFQIGRRFNMHIQPQLVLFQKTLLAVEGLGRSLYPELDLWSSAHPFLEKWMKQRVSSKAVIEHVQEKIPDWLGQFPELPSLVVESLEAIKEGRQQTPIAAIDPEKEKWKRLRGFSAGFGVALLAAMLLNLGLMQNPMLAKTQLTIASILLGSLGLVFIVIGVL